MKNVVEDIYPLSPMQQGMLFHTVLAPEGGDYVTQLAGTIEGAKTLAALEDAWQTVIRRNPILRTGFVWEGFKQPLQVVYREASLPCERRDWKHMLPDEQAREFDRFLEDDRIRGFDLSVAPLMRLTVFELAAEVYRFVWTHHHLLLDGWSLPLVMRELFTFAEASLDGRAVELPTPRPYRDYIAWLGEQDESEAERHWRGVLAGFTAPTPLGGALPREPRYSGASPSHREIRALVPSGVTEQLSAFARTRQLTLNTVVQGAWALLLSRHNSVSDVVFGATVCGRPPQLDGVESMVGLFINTQPVRCQVDPGADLVSWLQAIQTAQTEARQFEHCRLASIQGWSEVPRAQPLFESVVIFENYPAGAFSGLSRAIPIRDVRIVETTNFPLALIAAPGAELELRLNYDTARFDESSIAGLLRQLQTLLEGMAADPQSRLSELPVLTAQEQHQLTVEWNRTATPYPDDVCAHQWFEQVASRNPEAPAVVFGNETLSFGELNRRANRLAHGLRRRGVGPEVLVAVGLERSPDMIVAILGVMKAGGAYLPIAVDQPEERIGFMLNDASPRALVSTSGLRERLKAGIPTRCEWFAIDDTSLANESTDNPECMARPGNLAYVIYTSGSTGRPKGVMIEHRGLCNLAQSQGRLFEVAPGSRVLQFASATFDASVSEIFVTLLNEATLYLLRQDQLLGAELTAVLSREAINIATLPPTVLATLRDEELPALRTLVVAGEACGAELIHRWSAGRRMLNAYGPTEATVCATAWECDPESESVSIGRPIDNVRVYIVDAQMRPVPVGTAGELLIGGVGVARGYLQRPELTRERFIADPFSAEPGARLYRTGDRARFSSDGRIEFLGRIDRQLKIRGFRIEPGEIEAVLEEQGSVAKAVVTDREDTGRRRIVAYVTGRDGAVLAAPELRAALKRRLPEYMVPSAIVVLDQLPLTAHGKVDLAALPPPGTDRPELLRHSAAPRNAVEEALAIIWKDVLGLTHVGIDDDFFDLGGHSLLAMQLVSRLGEDLGVEVPIQLIFSSPTLAGVAEKLMDDPARRPGLIRAAELLASTADLSDDDLEALIDGSRMAA